MRRTIGSLAAFAVLLAAGNLARGESPQVSSTDPIQLGGGVLEITGPKDPTTPPLPAIDGLQLHLDGSDVNADGSVPEDGTSIPRWYDKSGNGFNAVAIGDPSYHADGLGDKGVVRIDGNDGFQLGNLSSSFPNAATLLVVATLHDANYNLFTTRNNDSWWRYHGNGLAYPGPFRNRRVEQYAPMPAEGSFIFEVTSDGRGWEMFQDGESLGTVAGNYDAGNDYRIGMYDDNTAEKSLLGDIAEILVYDTVLAEAERNDIRYFLQQRYDLGPLGPVTMADTPFSVIANSTLRAVTDSTASFGALTLQRGILTTSGAPTSFASTTLPASAEVTGIHAEVPTDPGPLTVGGGTLVTSGMPIAFDSTTILATATSVRFDSQTATDLGPISGGGAGNAVTVSKLGTETLTLDEANTGLTDATWRVEQGTLKLIGAESWGGAIAAELAGGTLVVAGAPGNEIVGPPDPQAYYAFDAPGDPGRDSSGQGYTAAFRNGAAWSADGVAGGAAAFDGVDDYLSAAVPVSETAYGVAMWLKTDKRNVGAFGVYDVHQGGSYDRQIALTDGNLMARLWSEEVITSSGLNLADGQWHHVVHTFGGANVPQKLYVDGFLAAQGAKAMSDFNWDRVINIGFARDAAAPFFDGMIDEVYVYDRVLNESDVLRLAGWGSLDLSATSVAVTADSTLDVRAIEDTPFAALTLRGGTVLTVTGTPVSFATTVIDLPPGESAVGINVRAETGLGVLDGGGATVNLVKTGPGALIVDRPGTGLDEATLDVREGELRAYHNGNPFGRGTLKLDGGNLLLSAGASASSSVDYPNALIVSANATLTAGPGDGGRAAPTVVRLGTATKGLTVAAGGLTLRSAGGYELDLAGGLDSPGDIVVDEGAVTFSAADNAVGTLKIAEGATGRVEQGVAVGQRLQLGQIRYDVRPGTSLTARGPDLLNDATLTLAGGRLSVSGPPIIPKDGLQLWLDAAAIEGLSDDEAVLSWPDQSGLDHHADLLGGTPRYVAHGPNGAPVVRFDGDDWLATSHNFDDLSAYSIVSVARYTGGANGRVIASRDDRNWLFGFHENQDEQWYAEGWIHKAGTGNTQWHLHAGTITGAADPRASFWKDGRLLTAGHGGSSNTTYQPGRLELGGWQGTSQMSKCEVAEILIYDRALSNDDLDVVGAYLSEKYGLATNYSDSPGGGIADQQTTHLVVTADARIDSPDAQISLGNLTVENPPAPEQPTTLTLADAAFRFQDVTAADGASIVGDLSVAGILIPGDSPGAIDVAGSLTMEGTSTYAWELGDGAADLIAVEGDLALDDGWTLEVIDAGVRLSEDDLLLFSVSGDVDLGQANLDLSGVTGPGFEGWRFDNPTVYEQLGNVYLRGVSVVPEPPVFATLALGLLALGFIVRRSRRGREAV